MVAENGVQFAAGRAMADASKMGFNEGALSSPALQNANQISAQFNGGQSIMGGNVQQTFTRIDNAVNVESNINKANANINYSAGVQKHTTAGKAIGGHESFAVG